MFCNAFNLTSSTMLSWSSSPWWLHVRAVTPTITCAAAEGWNIQPPIMDETQYWTISPPGKKVDSDVEDRSQNNNLFWNVGNNKPRKNIYEDATSAQYDMMPHRILLLIDWKKIFPGADFVSSVDNREIGGRGSWQCGYRGSIRDLMASPQTMALNLSEDPT